MKSISIKFKLEQGNKNWLVGNSIWTRALVELNSDMWLGSEES
jgi:hypothetical protein